MAVSAGRTAGLYVVVAACWIVLSDAAVGNGFDELAQTLKGLLFVAVTGSMLYGYVLLQVRRQEVYEKRLREVAEQLRGNLDGKTRLIQSLSHDLRQPLQSIALFAMVLESQSLTGKGREALGNLQTAVCRMADLLEAILGLARLDLGKLPVRKSRVPLDVLLRGLAVEMAPQAAAKGLRLRILPTATATASDPVILASILRNLIGNAIRYTDRGGVLVGVRRRGRDLQILVYDSGIGIAADKLPLVFEEFYQVGNSDRDFRCGLGLGLPIVERMARLLGHAVLARSTLGRGSCFGVVVPLVK